MEGKKRGDKQGKSTANMISNLTGRRTDSIFREIRNTPIFGGLFRMAFTLFLFIFIFFGFYSYF